MEKLKENSENNQNLDENTNLENQNEPKLLYRLDKRKPLCVAINLFLCLSVFWIPLLFIIAYKIHFISLIALWFEIFILQILYSVLFFDYVEIYENKIVYADIFGLKYILNNNELHWYGAHSRLSPETVFIAKKRTGSNKVTLGDNAEIALKGDKGVGAIVSEGAEFDGGKATINLLGKGVGVFGKKGSIINIGSWTFKNNGHNAEEVRSEEGQAHITSDKKIKPKITLTHVINGETSVDTGKTVTAEDDGTIKSEENIALMVEGIKNPSMTWKNPNFEAWNDGTIDFTNSKKSTAIYADSARIKNNGTIKMGENSVGIYGIYQAKTRKYDGSPDGFQNKLEITTTNKSIIELGKGSAGIYLKNAEKLNSEGTIKSSIGSTRNTGIFVQNGQDSEADNNKVLNMINKANINLGNGSVGIYSKGSSS
uniref:hypothetical protein n=1 Tax=uncultured Campylobacter sp. TaxID=218934 RepID=UPI00261C9BBA